jgi:hypothetical protein
MDVHTASTDIQVVTCSCPKCVGLHISYLLIFKAKALLTILKKYVSMEDITSFIELERLYIRYSL